MRARRLRWDAHDRRFLSRDVAHRCWLEGTSVYWVTSYGGTVMKCPVEGCAGNPTHLASEQAYPVSIAVDGKSLYWTNNRSGTVMKLPPK